MRDLPSVSSNQFTIHNSQFTIDDFWSDYICRYLVVDCVVFAQISRNDVAEELDGLPPIKMHCSNLAADGLQAAIENYYENNQ